MEWKRKSKRIFLCLINIEGEYFNGKTHGKGKEYNEHNELDFDGEFLYSYNFRGKQYANGKLFYESIYNTKIHHFFDKFSPNLFGKILFLYYKPRNFH